jgi:hypothetical protein
MHHSVGYPGCHHRRLLALVIFYKTYLSRIEKIETKYMYRARICMAYKVLRFIIPQCKMISTTVGTAFSKLFSAIYVWLDEYSMLSIVEVGLPFWFFTFC